MLFFTVLKALNNSSYSLGQDKKIAEILDTEKTMEKLAGYIKSHGTSQFTMLTVVCVSEIVAFIMPVLQFWFMSWYIGDDFRHLGLGKIYCGHIKDSYVPLLVKQISFFCHDSFSKK